MNALVRIPPALAALLRQRYHADDVTLLGSGTDALRVALELTVARAPRATVLLPAYTCYEVATAAVGAKAPVALYDVDPETLEPDWDSVRACASTVGAVAALVVAPLYGSIVDWDEARRSANSLGAPLIEDAAQAHGASWRDRPVGSWGDLSVLSFGRGKGWSGAGGGALLRRGDWSREAMGEVVTHSWMKEARTAFAAGAQIALSHPALYAVPAAMPFLHLGETIYHPPAPPRSMTTVSARLVLEGTARSHAEAAARRRNASGYVDALEARGVVLGRWRDARGEPGALRFPVRSRAGWLDLSRGQFARLGGGPPYPTTLAELPALAPLRRDAGVRAGAEALVRELVTLPTHARTTASSRAQVMDRLGTPEPVASVQRPGLAAGAGSRGVSHGSAGS